MALREEPTALEARRESEPAYPSTAWAWYTVIILLCAYIFSFIDRQILNLLVAPVRRDLNITDTEMSLLIGFSFAVFYSVLGLPFGRLADSVSRPRLIIIGMFTWSLMTGGCGLISSYGQLFMLRMGVGIGEATLSPAAYSMISDSFPPEKRSVPFSVYTMATYVGGGFAFLLGGLLLRYFGARNMFDLPIVGLTRPWQALFLLLGISGIVFILVLLTLRDPSRKGARILSTEKGKPKVESIPLAVVWKYFAENRKTLSIAQYRYGAFRACSLRDFCLGSHIPGTGPSTDGVARRDSIWHRANRIGIARNAHGRQSCRVAEEARLSRRVHARRSLAHPRRRSFPGFSIRSFRTPTPSSRCSTSRYFSAACLRV